MDGKLPGELQLLRRLGSPAVMAAAVAALLIPAASVLALLYLGGAFLPRWTEWDKEAEGRIPEGVRARMEDGWLVQDTLFTDIDGDGISECVLLVWKRGSYGKRRPTWVDKDEKGFSQHIFIYKDYGGNDEKDYPEGWHPLWMSSRLYIDAARIVEGDEIPGTGRKSLDIISPDGSATRWGWLTWGLTRVE